MLSREEFYYFNIILVCRRSNTLFRLYPIFSLFINLSQSPLIELIERLPTTLANYRVEVSKFFRFFPHRPLIIAPQTAHETRECICFSLIDDAHIPHDYANSIFYDPTVYDDICWTAFPTARFSKLQHTSVLHVLPSGTQLPKFWEIIYISSYYIGLIFAKILHRKLWSQLVG